MKNYYYEYKYLLNFKLPYVYKSECYECGGGGWNIGWKEFNLIKYKEVKHKRTKSEQQLAEMMEMTSKIWAKSLLDWNKRWYDHNDLFSGKGKTINFVRYSDIGVSTPNKKKQPNITGKKLVTKEVG
jgi:hypothetical protein